MRFDQSSFYLFTSEEYLVSHEYGEKNRMEIAGMRKKFDREKGMCAGDMASTTTPQRGGGVIWGGMRLRRQLRIIILA